MGSFLGMIMPAHLLGLLGIMKLTASKKPFWERARWRRKTWGLKPGRCTAGPGSGTREHRRDCGSEGRAGRQQLVFQSGQMSVRDEITVLFLRINAVRRQSFVANPKETILYNFLLISISFGDT